MPDKDRPVFAEISELLRGHTDRREERRVLEILASCPAGDLDALVASSHVGALVSSLDDRPLGPDHRTALLSLLTERRLVDLGVAARASLARALARGRTCAADERAVAAVFLGTRGEALSAMKEAIDAATDYHDLVQLLFHDLDDRALREAILGHFAREAAPPGAVRVLSDIDDTFYANWKDERYPGKTVYPGVRQVYAELAGAPDPASATVTFITARPGDRLGLTEDATRRALASRGLPRARVLAGAFTKLLGNDLIAEEKLANFERYRGAFPESRFVFLGDSGQGDVTFGERMRALSPGAVPAVLIHDVVATPEARRSELSARGVHLFDTYVGAALAAFEAGLLGAEGVARVAESAAREIAEIPFESAAIRAARDGELARDLARARAVTG